MKKVYKKPVVIVESFQLNAAIAGSCSDGTPINHYQDTCGYGEPMEDGFKFHYFVEFTCDVDVTLYTGDDNDQPCYHGPTHNINGNIFVWS